MNPITFGFGDFRCLLSIVMQFYVHIHMNWLSFFLLVARCQSESEEEVAETVEGGDLGIVGEDAQDFGDGTYSPAPGVDTVCIFPKNSARCKNL